MKKISLLLAAGALCFVVSCGKKGEGGMSATAKKNLDGMHAISKAINSGDFSKLGDYIAADAVDHSDQGDLKGLEAIKTNMMKYGEQSTDMSSDVIKELADDDYVMSWMKFKGTWKVDGMGMKKGDKYEMNGLEVSKCKDGKAVEHWTFMMPAEMMKMMGNPADMGPKKDTASNPN